MFERLKKDLQKKPIWPPPRQLPEDQKDAYLLNSYVGFKEIYHAHAGGDGSAVYQWSPVGKFEKLREQVRARQNMGSYGHEVQGMYRALESHPVTGQVGAVFGSQVRFASACASPGAELTA
jgi:hypothetical protein